MKQLQFCLSLSLLLAPFATDGKTALIIAGPASHKPGAHEHPAGCELLARHLASSGLGIDAELSLGWPADAAQLAAADTLVLFTDGGAKHPAAGHLADLRQRHEAGKGLALIHWSLGPADEEMAAFFVAAVGGQFEADWSVNPMWTLTAPIIAEHPASAGVTPFELEDEYYFHLRFRDGITPLLQAHPSAELIKKDGKYSGNPAVRKALADKVPQTLAWVVENESGSRGFGFTGGHYHANWANDGFRKLVLNGIAWTAGVEVPASGVGGELPATTAHETIDKAVGAGDLADVRLHLALDPASVNGTGSRTPLEQAIMRNQTGIATWLIAAGARTNAAAGASRTPLHLAVGRKNAGLVAALLAAGAKPDILDKGGWTPLHHAAAENQLEVARALLAGGANPMTLSELGGTPLHEAAASGGPDLIRLLLEHKVDPTVKSEEGVTALDLAKKYENQPAVDILAGL